MIALLKRLTPPAIATWAVLMPVTSAAGQGTASSEDAGSVVVVDAVNTDRQLAEFDSTTAFRLRLPEGAACAGDSANDDYRVQTFLVPADTDLSALKYRSRSPDGNDLYRALKYSDGEVATQLVTNQNPGPGSPGLILEPRLPFTFAYYSENSLPPGQWSIGVACTPFDWQVDRYWDAGVVLEAAPDVEPGGLRIRVTSPAEAPKASETAVDPMVVAALSAAALAVGGTVIGQRIRNRKPSTLKESA